MSNGTWTGVPGKLKLKLKHQHSVLPTTHFTTPSMSTGWCDVALTQRGVVEANEAGEVFQSHNLIFRKCYSSLLTRSIVTAQRALEAAGVSYTPMEYDWRLNERHYGALQGLSKERTADRLGKTLVMQWRRSYEARPPVMTDEHPHHDIINKDHRYRNVAIPNTESLEDCQKRVIEAWRDITEDCISANKGDSPYTLVVAHANSLRALVMYLDDIPADEIENLNIPTGIPFYYDIDKSTSEVLSSNVACDKESLANVGHGKFRGIYISDDRKKRNFLERRRAANDPWLWALHDNQVARSMLVGEEDDDKGPLEGMDGLVEEAARNTELFSPSARRGKPDDDFYLHEH
jgi:2,3-bisphosphoglycerate-dependent phosphoglycerate mutase